MHAEVAIARQMTMSRTDWRVDADDAAAGPELFLPGITCTSSLDHNIYRRWICNVYANRGSPTCMGRGSGGGRQEGPAPPYNTSGGPSMLLAPPGKC